MLCQTGEIVSYPSQTQIRKRRTEIGNLHRNHALTFLALWLENKNSSVLLMNDGGLAKMPSSEKYVVIRPPQLSENIAISPLSILSRMHKNHCSFQKIPSLASHVFCKTSQDHAINACETNQFTCSDGTCILDIYQCDGTFHCQDGSDEDARRPFCHAKQGSYMDITNSICAELCKAPSCVCDGLHFQCRNGGCVPWSHVCDCKRDCQDGSDEQFCLLCYHGRDLNYPSENEVKYVERPKKQGTFVCGDKEIIPLEWVGDQVSDCHGTSDDELLYHMYLSTGERNFTGCTSGHTTCVLGFGKCFPVEATCVYEKDKRGKTKYCTNGIHFLSCDNVDCQSRFKCPHAYCIESYMVCDAQFDCPNGEDEGLFCERPSCPGMFKCSESSVCVHPRHIGDGTPHCVLSADDESVYSSFCEPGCKCRGMVKDCSFAKIESSKVTTTLSGAWAAVILQNTLLQSVPYGYLSSTLVIVDFSFNHITQIRPGEVKFLYNLHELYLQHNLIEFIRPLTFFGLSSLQKLVLASNGISNLSANSFLGLYNLVWLNLDNNAIKYIAPCTFGGLNRIEALTLKRNNLTEITSAMLCGLDNVRYLDLSFNQIQAIQLLFTISEITITVHLMEYCCLLPRHIECVPLNSHGIGQYKCPQILKIKIVNWLLGSAVFLANIVAPICWSKLKSPHGIMAFLVSLLHTVDCLAALPLLVTAAADIVYGSHYRRYASEWTQGVVCKGVAYIGYVAFILSMGCITLIARQRYLGIAYPLHKRKISRKFALIYVSMSFVTSSACVLATLLVGSPSGSVQLNPLCMIYAQPTGGLKSKWFACLYILMNVSIIPLIYFSIAAVYSLLKLDTVPSVSKIKRKKPVFKMFFTLIVYVLICGSHSIMEIIHIWQPLTDIGRLVVFIVIFPLHSLTNPWVVTIIPSLQSACT